jgi:hypothetical protein
VSEQSGQPDDSDLATADPQFDLGTSLLSLALLLGTPAGLIYLAIDDTPSGWVKWPTLIGAGWLGLALLVSVALVLRDGSCWLRDRRQ